MAPRSNSLTLSFRGILAGGESGSASVRKAVTEVFLELRGPVYRYLLGMLEPADAEDAVQETFLRLFSEVQSGRSISNVRAWVFQTAHNLAVDRHRRCAREEHWDEQAWRQVEERLRTPGPDGQHAVLEEERLEYLRAALSRLTPQERRSMELRAEGLRYREIAEVLGIKISSVQIYLARAIGKVMRRGDA